MIEAFLLTLALAFVILLLRYVARGDAKADDAPLGLFSYKSDKAEQSVKFDRKG